MQAFARTLTLMVALAVAGTLRAAPESARPGWAGASDDFSVQLFLTPGKDAFFKMWAKPAPPALRIFDTAEIGTRVAAVLIYRGGRPNAEGQCDLVARFNIDEPDGRIIEGSSEQPVCSSPQPAPRERFMLGRSTAEFVPDGKPRSLLVTATVTDRSTGKVVVVSAPLKLVPRGSLFHFESVHSIDEMQDLIRQRFALGVDREAVRHFFALDGRATVIRHPTWSGVEKYLYDIDLCSYYVWRWNISADYDEQGGLRQAYVNGEIVFPEGTPARVKPVLDNKSKLFKGTRPRPEASKGESSLAFTFFDVDGDPATIEDQYLFGAGPTRPDPLDMGKLHVYSAVDPWRSIFDNTRAEPIATYGGSCEAADKKYEEARR